MILFTVRRLLWAVLTLVVVLLFTFWIFFSLSPDPAAQICGQTCTPDRIEQIRQVLGIDRPFFAQFFTFLSGIFAGRTIGAGPTAVQCPAPCLGYSFQTGQNVAEMIGSRLPITITLAVGALVLWVIAGTIGGVLSAVKRGTWWDKAAMSMALAGVALPNYFVALLLQYVVVVKLQWLPFPSNDPSFTDDPGTWFTSFLMPWLVLALMYSATFARLTRANVIDTLGENFIRTADAKGLRPFTVLTKHALRPAMTPLVTIVGLDFATLLGGALITESVFGLQGVGKLARDAISTNDQPIIMAVTLLAATIVVLMNIVVDLLYAALDPRVRVGTR